jgi:hypothetical protein
MIRFRYELGGVGWASATLSDGRSEATFPASYLSDALRDFVDAVHGLFTTDTAEVRWDEEPGAVLWEFQRNGSRVFIRVRWHDGRESFEGDEDLLRFGSDVGTQLENLLFTWGADGYAKHWHHPFPQEAHEKLKHALNAARQRRGKAGQNP